MILDPVAVERAESEIDTFILKRNRERDDANGVEEVWRLSEARERARRREANRAGMARARKAYGGSSRLSWTMTP